MSPFATWFIRALEARLLAVFGGLVLIALVSLVSFVSAFGLIILIFFLVYRGFLLSTLLEFRFKG